MPQRKNAREGVWSWGRPTWSMRVAWNLKGAATSTKWILPQSGIHSPDECEAFIRVINIPPTSFLRVNFTLLVGLLIPVHFVFCKSLCCFKVELVFPVYPAQSATHKAHCSLPTASPSVSHYSVNIMTRLCLPTCSWLDIILHIWLIP